MKNYKEYGMDDLMGLTAPEAITLRDQVNCRRAFILENYAEVIRDWDDYNYYIAAIESRISKQPVTKPKAKRTNLYLMRDLRTNLVKIGISINPSTRERTLQSESPMIELEWQAPSTSDEEKELHLLFKEKRIRGEWFNLSKDDVDYVKSLEWRVST